MIDDTSNELNINSQKIKELSTSIKKIDSDNSTGNINLTSKKEENKFQQQNQSNEELSSITIFNRTNLNNTSSNTNFSMKKSKRPSKISKIKNEKLSFGFSKVNEKDNTSIDHDNNKKVNKDCLDKKELRWNLYNKYVGLKYKLESNNNHRIGTFFESLSTLPKIVDDKLNKSFKFDEKIKETHYN